MQSSFTLTLGLAVVTRGSSNLSTDLLCRYEALLRSICLYDHFYRPALYHRVNRQYIS
jgi:hypothetical protein